jgi:hypothetical protein
MPLVLYREVAMTLTTLPRAHCARWFRLDRHDDPPVPANPPTDPPADPPKLDDALGEPGKKALAEERAARKAAEKALAEREAKLKEFEDRDKTEAEKLAARAAAAEKAAQTATARAVQFEVKALADGWADREDAVLHLGDLSRYVKDGEVDSDAIKAELTAVLGRKPHLAATPTSRTPAPDPSQGRGGDPTPTDFRTASKADFDAELAKHGLRPQSYS